MITQEMVMRFNEMLIDDECPLRIYKNPGNNYSYEIKVMRHHLVDNTSLVYPTDEFYNMLKRYFGSYDVSLTFNNTGTTFWSL